MGFGKSALYGCGKYMKRLPFPSKMVYKMKGFGPQNGISPFKTLFSNLPSGLEIN